MPSGPQFFPKNCLYRGMGERRCNSAPFLLPESRETLCKGILGHLIEDAEHGLKYEV